MVANEHARHLPNNPTDTHVLDLQTSSLTALDGPALPQ